MSAARSDTAKQTDVGVQGDSGDDLGIIQDKAVYPQYSSLEVRKQSFNAWSARSKPNTEVLSKAGFAYTGVGDSVRCYYCGGGLRDWKEDDSPWEQHALVFPLCGHIRRCKGVTFIKAVRATQSIHDDTEQDEEEVEGPTVIDWDSLDILSTAMKVNSVAISAVKEFSTDDVRIRHGICWLLSRHKTSFSAAELLNAIEDSDLDPIDDEALVSENAELRRPVTCKICLDAVASIVTLPCGHMFSCPQCIAPLSACAVCRAEITGTVKASLCTTNNETIA